MLASSQGGINIEEVARDDPDSILTEPVDIDVGIFEEQARTVAEFMGFEGDKVDQVQCVRNLLLSGPCEECELFGWWRGSVVRTSVLAGELSLTCTRPAADG